MEFTGMATTTRKIFVALKALFLSFFGPWHQCDQMARLFLKYLAIYNIDICPKAYFLSDRFNNFAK